MSPHISKITQLMTGEGLAASDGAPKGPLATKEADKAWKADHRRRNPTLWTRLRRRLSSMREG